MLGRMDACYAVPIETPKKFILNGLWFGPKSAKRVIVYVHGLSSSMFSRLSLLRHLTDARTAVLVFDTRGAHTIGRTRRVRGKGRLSGGAYERFHECIDDIEGAVRFARRQGAREIILAGHSTGSQKAALYASKKGVRLAGVILLAPLSDFAGVQTHSNLRRATLFARRAVARGAPHELMPEEFGFPLADAQRFLSLYTPDSVEQRIFSYFDPMSHSKVLAAIRTPILVLLAGADEYGDRPARDIALWFEGAQRARSFEVRIVPRARHSFSRHEAVAVRIIRGWLRSL